MTFKFCPDCGALLSRRDLGDDKDVPWCDSCSRPWFPIFPSAIIALVYNDRGEVLLLRQSYISTEFCNLVSGYILPGEDAESCARREIKEETGLENAFLQQFHTFTDVDRDPRGRVITIAYFALVKISEVKGGDDASNAAWFSINQIPKLAFDHDMILRMAFSKLKERMHFEPVGFELLPEVFKMPQLQNLYESILEVHFDRANFAKKMLAMDILDETDDRSENASRRIPKMYRFNLQKYEAMKSKGFRMEF